MSQEEQREVHFRATLTHLHRIVYPQSIISSRQDSEASGRMLHSGCLPVSGTLPPAPVFWVLEVQEQ